MNRNNIAYLINSTPKYYYILELHLVLLRRYAHTLKWQVYLATEEPDHLVCKLLQEKYKVEILVLEKENSSFLSSRKRALELLPESIQYVIPMQEDFLLERNIDMETINESIDILDNYKNIFCIRYMPCPGPNEKNPNFNDRFRYFNIEHDFYMFSFQASLWKKNECLRFYTEICNKVKSYGVTNSVDLEVRNNIAENIDGQTLFNNLFSNSFVVGYKRTHSFPNAVYMSPWPYRPTAIIKGVLQPFAKELAEREGVKLIF
uniref:Glycosyltransferase n=1 Tax=viral metagenome TaxID=1070528 RepID=A0A6C0D6X3_9ZZZZ